MRKVIAILAIVAGGLLVAAGAFPMLLEVILKRQIPASTGIIGGADGPTAIFVAGSLGTDTFVVAMLVGVLLIIAGLIVKLNEKR